MSDQFAPQSSEPVNPVPPTGNPAPPVPPVQASPQSPSGQPGIPGLPSPVGFPGQPSPAGFPGQPGSASQASQSPFPGQPQFVGQPVQPGQSQFPGRPVQAPTPASRKVMDLSDGEWHRMHPLTPLLQGGLVLVIVMGYLIANMRDRLIEMFVPSDFSEYQNEYGGDPVDWVVANNFVFIALGGVLVVVLLVVGIMYLTWRFHTVRVSEGAVEVRKGVIFRSQRRAPLDRVQGVNLTRPFLARLIGLSKLEVVGAGTDSNVALEYLSTPNAERVRADILRWASGSRQAKQSGGAGAVAGTPGAQLPGGQSAPLTRSGALVQDFTDGVTGLVLGAEQPVAEPASVVHIPVSRMIMSRVASVSTLVMLGFIAAIIMGAIFGRPEILFGLVPGVIGLGTYYVSSLTSMFRYAIAPTPDGVRVTAGLTTTVTETIPPGRIHALQVTQSAMWRKFGWYRITINRISGKSATEQAKDPFTTLLPVGTRADALRVVGLVFPGVPADQLELIVDRGLQRVTAGDPFTMSPPRAWFVHPLARRRNGFLLTERFLVLRRGWIWRRAATFPLERAQSMSLDQGPLLRLAGLANLQVQTVPGIVAGSLRGIARDDALSLFTRAEQAAVSAARLDRSHRWAEDAATIAVAAPTIASPIVPPSVPHAVPGMPPAQWTAQPGQQPTQWAAQPGQQPTQPSAHWPVQQQHAPLTPPVAPGHQQGQWPVQQVPAPTTPVVHARTPAPPVLPAQPPVPPTRPLEPPVPPVVSAQPVAPVQPPSRAETPTTPEDPHDS